MLLLTLYNSPMNYDFLKSTYFNKSFKNWAQIVFFFLPKQYYFLLLLDTLFVCLFNLNLFITIDRTNVQGHFSSYSMQPSWSSSWPMYHVLQLVAQSFRFNYCIRFMCWPWINFRAKNLPVHNLSLGGLLSPL